MGSGVVVGCEVDDGGRAAGSSCLRRSGAQTAKPTAVYRRGYQDDARLSNAEAGYATRGDITDLEVCCRGGRASKFAASCRKAVNLYVVDLTGIKHGKATTNIAPSESGLLQDQPFM